MIVAYAAFFLILGIDLWTDYALIEQQKTSPDHVTGAFIRITALTLPALYIGWGDWSRFFACLFHFAALFWLLFDMFLNRFRGKALFYVGYTAWVDRTYRAVFVNPELPMLTTKLVLLILSIIWVYVETNAS